MADTLQTLSSEHHPTGAPPPEERAPDRSHATGPDAVAESAGRVWSVRLGVVAAFLLVAAVAALAIAFL